MAASNDAMQIDEEERKHPHASVSKKGKATATTTIPIITHKAPKVGDLIKYNGSPKKLDQFLNQL